VLASLAELELELGRERRAAAREARRARGQAIKRPKALDQSKAARTGHAHQRRTGPDDRCHARRQPCDGVSRAGRIRTAGIATTSSVRTQTFGAAGEALVTYTFVTYKLFKHEIDSARMTTDACVDLQELRRQCGSNRNGSWCPAGGKGALLSAWPQGHCPKTALGQPCSWPPAKPPT
jgi:hypothetical protein